MRRPLIALAALTLLLFASACSSEQELAPVPSPTPAQVVVPDLTGLSKTAVTPALGAVGLELGEVTYKDANGLSAGQSPPDRDTVVSQNPAPGASVPTGFAVAVTLSTGELVSVPGTAL